MALFRYIFVLCAIYFQSAVAQTTLDFCYVCSCEEAEGSTLVICDKFLPGIALIQNSVRVGNNTLLLRTDFDIYELYKKKINSLFYAVIIEDYRATQQPLLSTAETLIPADQTFVTLDNVKSLDQQSNKPTTIAEDIITGGAGSDPVTSRMRSEPTESPVTSTMVAITTAKIIPGVTVRQKVLVTVLSTRRETKTTKKMVGFPFSQNVLSTAIPTPDISSPLSTARPTPDRSSSLDFDMHTLKTRPSGTVFSTDSQLESIASTPKIALQKAKESLKIANQTVVGLIILSLCFGICAVSVPLVVCVKVIYRCCVSRRRRANASRTIYRPPTPRVSKTVYRPPGPQDEMIAMDDL